LVSGSDNHYHDPLQSLKHIFGSYGKIQRVLLRKNKVGSGSAYITFAREEDARQAIISKDGTSVEGHTLRFLSLSLQPELCFLYLTKS